MFFEWVNVLGIQGYIRKYYPGDHSSLTAGCSQTPCCFPNPQPPHCRPGSPKPPQKWCSSGEGEARRLFCASDTVQLLCSSPKFSQSFFLAVDLQNWEGFGLSYFLKAQAVLLYAFCIVGPCSYLLGACFFELQLVKKLLAQPGRLHVGLGSDPKLECLGSLLGVIWLICH